MRSESRLQVFLLAIVIAALAISAVSPADRVTWLMEVLPVMVAIPLLFATRSGFPLTPLLYILIAVHALVLIVGGTYTYAHVPAGFWLQDMFGFERNPYDRVGHFFQGFVPALVAREILLRKHVLGKGGWLFSWSAAYAWPSLPCMSSSNGAPRWRWGRGRSSFSAPRATLGIPSPTWRWR